MFFGNKKRNSTATTLEWPNQITLPKSFANWLGIVPNGIYDDRYC